MQRKSKQKAASLLLALTLTASLAMPALAQEMTPEELFVQADDGSLIYEEAETYDADAQTGTYGDLTYIVNSDGKTCTITDCSESVSGEVTVPETIDGYTVTVIGDGAFDQCRSMTKINLPNGLIKIGGWAFQCCWGLTAITIPDTVTRIDSGAFNICNFTSVTIPASVTEIGYSPFMQCYSLTELKVAEGNASYCAVDNVLFNADKTELIECVCGKSGSYTIPNSVTDIRKEAFFGCGKLSSITIPDTVKNIGEMEFDYCRDLTEIVVSDGNANYCSEDGILFNKGKTELIAYPANKSGSSYIIPDGVTSLARAAFDGSRLTSVTIPDGMTSISDSAFRSSALTSITIPDGVTSIGYQAFGYCSSLASITIPSSVTSIDDLAFGGCAALKDVYYGGSEADRENIEIGQFSNDELLNAAWHYSSAGSTSVTNGWRTENGKQYWYENGVRQGTTGRGKEIYDPGSNGWYWLDAVQGGAKAVSKEVFQEYADGNSKWVRYDADGHMIKGWYTNSSGTYYYDLITGAMQYGLVTIDGLPCAFDSTTGVGLNLQWVSIDGKDYWYENGKRQGYDPNNAAYRGKEIYDPTSNGWYWLDNVQQGAKATSKDVYQESGAGQWAANADGTGKWVRYDADGHMIKGWQTTGRGTYYFDPIYGTMAKNTVTIDGKTYRFDGVTGILQ